VTGSRPRELEALEDLLQRGYRFALSLTHEPMRAEDLLQDAWLSILSSGGPRHVGYLFTAIRNRFFDLERRAKLLIVEPLGTNEEAVPDAEPADILVEEKLRIDLLTLEQALGQLRPEEREALFLTAVEGYTAQEVAELTGRPRGTILSLVHRARLKIRRHAGQGHEERRA
jgi:RNA polymerase sigma-70 factor (ECF subfamily)